MADYIEREKVIELIDYHQEEYCEAESYFGLLKEDLQKLPSADVAPMEWIPVTERLPDFEGMCLCMRKSYSKANFRHQEIMYFDYDEQAFCSNADGVFVADGNVTHWMRLPKPPVLN